MTLSRRSIVLFDASVVLAAAGSAHGGSALLMNLCARGYFEGAVSDQALAEIARNAEFKFSGAVAAHVDRLLAAAAMPEARRAPIDTSLPINAKDRHLLEAAVGAGAGWVITLDARLVAELRSADLPVAFVTPRDFIRAELPAHPDFPFTHH